jgi:hypothetical protein
MKFTNTLESDIEQLTEWIAVDPYHKDFLSPRWWLTGAEYALTCFCAQDETGPVIYVRLDKENDLLRFHAQFGPESEVSKSRVAKAIIKGIPVLEQYAKAEKLKGLVYKSTSETLIQFLQISFGFTPTGANDDYFMPFKQEG